MFLLWIGSAWAVCPATSANLAESLEAAEAAFADMDTAAFLTATNRVTAEANCLAESTPRSVIARLHRVEGLRAFVDKDNDRAARAFAAGRSIEPAYTFPEQLVPAGHPVRTQYTTLNPDAGGSTAVPAPASGYLAFDGRTTTARPNGRPTLAQLVGDDGGVAQSRYLWPDDPMFDYLGVTSTVAATDAATPLGTTAAPSRKKGPNVGLAIAAGTTLAAGAASWLVAKNAHDEYYAADVDVTQLDALRARSNAFSWLAVGAGVAGVGLGVGAVVGGHW